MPTVATPLPAYSARTAPSWRSTWRTYGQWLQRNITSSARPSRSASLTVDPSADGSSKSCAGVPSGTISEETAMGGPFVFRSEGGRTYASGHGLPLHAGGPGGVQTLPPAVGLRGQGAPKPGARRGGRPRPGAGRARRPGRLLLPRHVGLAALGGAAAGPPGPGPVPGWPGGGRRRPGRRPGPAGALLPVGAGRRPLLPRPGRDPLRGEPPRPGRRGPGAGPGRRAPDPLPGPGRPAGRGRARPLLGGGPPAGRPVRGRRGPGAGRGAGGRLLGHGAVLPRHQDRRDDPQPAAPRPGAGGENGLEPPSAAAGPLRPAGSPVGTRAGHPPARGQRRRT